MPRDAMNLGLHYEIASSLRDAMNSRTPKAPDYLKPWETMNPGTPEAPNHLKSEGFHEPQNPQKPQNPSTLATHKLWITSNPWGTMNPGTPKAPGPARAS